MRVLFFGVIVASILGWVFVIVFVFVFVFVIVIKKLFID